MKSTMKHIFTVLLLFLCVSCISDGETRAVLDQVEALIEENPAEAYELVKGIDGAAISSSAVNARYALLYTKAEYKNYIDAPTDSLISIATDYYERHGSDEEKFYAYLYQGCVNYGIKDYTSSMKAVDVLLKANDYVDAVDNYKDVGLMYIQLSTLYGEQKSTDEEICARKAYEAYEKAKSESHVLNAMGRIAMSKIHQSDYDSCFILADSMLNRAIGSQNTKYMKQALWMKAHCAVLTDSIELAVAMYSLLINNYDYYLKSQDYSNLAIINASMNEEVEAESNLVNAIGVSQGNSDSLYYYAAASNVYRLLGNDTLTYSYQDSVLQMENKMLIVGHQHTSLATQKDHADYLLSVEITKNKLRVSCFISALLIIALILVIVANYAKKQNILASIQAEKIHNLQKELEEHKQDYSNRLLLLKQTDIVIRFHKSLSDFHDSIHDSDWTELYRVFCVHLPSFEENLKSIHDLTQTEWRVCMLLKLGFSSIDIARITNKSATAIPSIRSRLYKKFFLVEGKAAEWDLFIASL